MKGAREGGRQASREVEGCMIKLMDPFSVYIKRI
jgi:hypothetical protein